MKKINYYWHELGLIRWREILFCLLLAVLGLGLGIGLYFLTTPNYLFFVLAVILAVLLPALYFMRYPSMLKKMAQQRELEFSNVLGFYKIYLEHGMNTYQAFEAIIPLATPWLAQQIQSFLGRIDENKSVEPYIELAHKFKSGIIEQILISIFQISESGYVTKVFASFADLNASLHKEKAEMARQLQESRLQMCTIFPLVAAGLMTIIITLGVITSIGGIVNG